MANHRFSGANLEDGLPVDGSVVIGSPPLISAMDFGHLEEVPRFPDPRKTKTNPGPMNHPLKDDPPSICV